MNLASLIPSFDIFIPVMFGVLWIALAFSSNFNKIKFIMICCFNMLPSLMLQLATLGVCNNVYICEHSWQVIFRSILFLFCNWFMASSFLHPIILSFFIFAGLNIYFWLSFVPAIVSFSITFSSKIWATLLKSIFLYFPWTYKKVGRAGGDQARTCHCSVSSRGCWGNRSMCWDTTKATWWSVLVWKTRNLIVVDTIYFLSGDDDNITAY